MGTRGLKRLARWFAMLMAGIAGLVFVFATRAWMQTVWLPYNSEGRYFDDSWSVVVHDSEPQFWAMLAVTSAVLA